MSPIEIPIALIAITLGLGILAFWIWMIVDCIQNETREGHDRLIWVLIIVLTKLVGATIYYFVRYRPRLAARAAG
jgi:prolipoprotein diacylglyceryltransferase